MILNYNECYSNDNERDCIDKERDSNDNERDCIDNYIDNDCDYNDNERYSNDNERDCIDKERDSTDNECCQTASPLYETKAPQGRKWIDAVADGI